MDDLFFFCLVAAECQISPENCIGLKLNGGSVQKVIFPTLTLNGQDAGLVPQHQQTHQIAFGFHVNDVRMGIAESAAVGP